jgi:hypothetical protein
MLTWARIAELLLELINSLISLFQKKERENDSAAAQKQEDNINSDPADWFNNHFNSGVRGQESTVKDSTTPAPTSSDKPASK